MAGTRSLTRAVLYLCERLLDRRAQTIGAEIGQQHPVDEDCRGAFDAVQLAVFDVAANVRVVFAAFKFQIESFPVESDLRRILFQRIGVQRALISKQDIDVLPKLSLRIRGTRGLGGAKGVRMRRS